MAHSAELPRMAARPVFEKPSRDTRIEFRGLIGERVRVNQENWLRVAPSRNPAMIQMMRDRDLPPEPRKLQDWAGEFAGKYLLSAILGWRITRDPELRRVIGQFVRDLIAAQAADGYLGPWPRDHRLVHHWDVWGHKHVLLGLLLYYEDTGDEAVLAACRRIADLMCRTFGDGPGQHRMIADNQGQMDHSFLYPLCLLYRVTGEPRYLDFAHWITRDWSKPPAGNYIAAALEGRPFHRNPLPRWETLPHHQGIFELWQITGDPRLRQAVLHAWNSMVQGDRHNTGGWSTHEKACGNPYEVGPIETCCTLAYVALSIDVLRLTGDSRVADEIEWSELNGMIGSQGPDGKGWTYNTPMDGVRLFGKELGWQHPVGGPDLSCCMANAARGIGMLWEWAAVRSPKGLVLNYYGPCDIHTILPSGNRVTIKQDTTYPLDGCIAITVHPGRPERFELGLRIPRWSKKPSVLLGGEPPLTPIPGTYYNIEREWRPGDTVILTLDLPLRVWSGDAALQGRASAFRGPLLLAADARHNAIALDKLPPIDASSLPKVSDLREGIGEKPVHGIPSRRSETFGREEGPKVAGPQPWLTLSLQATDGRAIVLTDFLSAGNAGTPYRSWLPAVNLPPSQFWLAAPADGAEVRPGEVTFRWDAAPGATSYRLLVSARRILAQPVADLRDLRPQMETVRLKDEKAKQDTEVTRQKAVQEAKAAIRLPEGRCYWTVIASNEHGELEPANSPFSLTVKP